MLTPSLSLVPTEKLTARLYELRRLERTALVEFLTVLAELDRRREFLAMGFSSLFAFLTQHLGYTSSSAYRRSTAARLLARFPIVADYLVDGRLNLTTLVELRSVLEEGAILQILDRAAGRSEDEVRVLVASLHPREAPADLFRRCPTSAVVPTAGPAVEVTSPPVPLPQPPRRTAMVPVDEERHVLRVTVGKDFAADLTQVRALLSHQIPDGNLERVLHECLRIALRTCTKRKRGAGKPTPKSDHAQPTRHVPAAIRNEVWSRDASACTFIGTSGKTCGSTHQLELHHIIPFAQGDSSTSANLTLHCRAHNDLQARRDYGNASIDRRTSPPSHPS